MPGHARPLTGIHVVWHVFSLHSREGKVHILLVEIFALNVRISCTLEKLAGHSFLVLSSVSNFYF